MPIKKRTQTKKTADTKDVISERRVDVGGLPSINTVDPEAFLHIYDVKQESKDNKISMSAFEKSIKNIVGAAVSAKHPFEVLSNATNGTSHELVQSRGMFHITQDKKEYYELVSLGYGDGKADGDYPLFQIRHVKNGVIGGRLTFSQNGNFLSSNTGAELRGFNIASDTSISSIRGAGTPNHDRSSLVMYADQAKNHRIQVRSVKIDADDNAYVNFRIEEKVGTSWVVKKDFQFKADGDILSGSKKVMFEGGDIKSNTAIEPVADGVGAKSYIYFPTSLDKKEYFRAYARDTGAGGSYPYLFFEYVKDGVAGARVELREGTKQLYSNGLELTGFSIANQTAISPFKGSAWTYSESAMIFETDVEKKHRGWMRCVKNDADKNAYFDLWIQEKNASGSYQTVKIFTFKADGDILSGTKKVAFNIASPKDGNVATMDSAGQPTNSGKALSAFFTQGANLGANVNLNDMRTTGWYQQTANANTSTALNYPEALAGVLHVYTEGSFTIQKYDIYEPSYARTHERRFYNNAWGAWKRVAMTDSPAFTGTPTAPTQASTDNSTKLATTAFVKTAITSVGTTPIGTYLHIDTDTAPSGWVLADGRTLPTSYKEYYAKFPDGKVRDMRGRFLMSAQTGVYNRGTMGGASTAALKAENNGPHKHSITTSHEGGGNDVNGWPSTNRSAPIVKHDENNADGSETFNDGRGNPLWNSGSGTSFSILNPYLAMPCYCYVGLVTTTSRTDSGEHGELLEELAQDWLDESQMHEQVRDITRKVSPLENGIAGFEYLNGGVMFLGFADANEVSAKPSSVREELYLYEEEAVEIIPALKAILEPLKAQRLLCTLHFATSLEKRAILTNSLVRRRDFLSFETVEEWLAPALQDSLQEVLNSTSFGAVLEAKAENERKKQEALEAEMQAEQEKWELENPLEVLRGKKLDELEATAKEVIQGKSFEESRNVLEKRERLAEYIRLQGNAGALEGLDVRGEFGGDKPDKGLKKKRFKIFN